MTDQEARELIEKYNLGTASTTEVALLQHWFINEATRRGEVFSDKDRELFGEQVWISLQAKTKPVKIGLERRIIIAAAAVAAIVFGVWFYTSRPSVDRSSEIANQNDIKPGKNIATLTLSNGKTISLSDAKTGVIINAKGFKYNDNTAIIPNSELSSVYAGGVEGGAQALTTSTPRGGTYQVTLPDGSRVWLNAASSLTFLSTLGQNEQRRVKLRGEAYFEVTKMKKRPFIVTTSGQEVEVLGTHFNISAYESDKNTTTSLLEGSVRVNVIGKGNSSSPGIVSSVVLKPNQQSILSGNAINIKEIDPDYPVAWKNGYFMFASEPLKSIMKKLSRWYDVDVDFQGEITTEGFTGFVSKHENVSEVLKTLELTGLVHFKIQGRRITVMP